MPLYLFEHPDTGEVVEVVQKMNDFHIYIDYDGLEWNRVWVAPNASVDSASQVNPWDEKAFVKKTDDKHGTVGDLWDYSRELSEKRIAKEGKDPIKEKWSKERAKKLGKKRRNFMRKQAKQEVVRREREAKKKK